MPIFSYGVVAVRLNPHTGLFEYLMVRPKYSIEYLAIMRGHYSPLMPDYVTQLCRYLTDEERELIQTGPFSKLYEEAHGTYKEHEYNRAHRLYLQLCAPSPQNKMMTWATHLQKAADDMTWEETDWGFPKGRREKDETESACAYREFYEETGISAQYVRPVQNVAQFHEIFTGTDNRVYKHIYYLAMLPWAESERYRQKKEDKEIQEVRWFSFPEGLGRIRNYQHNRRLLLQHIHDFILSHPIQRIKELFVLKPHVKFPAAAKCN
jgi:8-oxo-dGTP pyrophosphatase MutT (NUDIX family)